MKNWICPSCPCISTHTRTYWLKLKSQRRSIFSLQNWYKKIVHYWIVADKLVNMNHDIFLGKRLIHWCTYFESPLQVNVTNVARTVGMKPNTRWWQNYVLIFSQILLFYDSKVDLDILTNTAWLESKAKIWRDSQSNTWKRRPAQQSWVCLHTRKGARSFVSPWSEDMVWYVSVDIQSLF